MPGPLTPDVREPPADDCTDGCSRCVELSAQLAEVTAIARDQARALAELTEESPPWAPSVAIVYWLYAPTRQADKSWRHHWNRLVPTINGLGDLPAIKLTPQVWSAHRAARAREPSRTGEPPCDHTLNIELWRAKEMMDWAVAAKLIRYNPLAPAKGVETVSQRETWLPPDGLEKLLHAADDVVDGRLTEGDDDGYRTKVIRAFALCCFDSMLRFNEARAIRRDRISADGALELSARETKSKRRRVVVLTPRTLEAIAAIPRHPSSHAVFVRPATGELLPEQTLRAWFGKARELAGIDAYAAPGEGRIRPHDLRSGGATTADERGARATALRDTLGHASVAMTERYLRSGALDNARHVAGIMSEAPRIGPRRAAPQSTRGRKNLATPR